MPELVYSFGPYSAYKGKLAYNDSREAYVTGPDLTGRICPIASFWSVDEAIRWIKKLHEEASA